MLFATESFAMAMTLLHELAHAAKCVARGDGSGHHFFPGTTVSEEGYNWEQIIFGGVPRTVSYDDLLSHYNEPTG